jgi:type IV pilus assembly protein PilA
MNSSCLPARVPARLRKGFTLIEIMIVVVIIGLLAAIAVPAFNKVRSTAQEKAIVNNLRQIASAGQQYLINNGSVASVTYEELVTANYLKAINPVGSESYAGLTVASSPTEQTLSVTSASVNEGAPITYTF